jgi:tetratricopeptide (TPR) repeat protein
VSDTKQTTRRQLVEDARQAAIEGRWENALTINQQIVERSPRDAAAYNRIGKAQLELGNVQEAIDAYSSSLKADAANMIARRNLHRLEQLGGRESEIERRGKKLTPRTSVFIQEVGKTWVDEIINPAATDVLADVASGEALALKVKSGRLLVIRSDGVELGEIDPRTAARVIELMASGNTYEIYALGQSSAGLRIILRETYRDPSQADRVSFPRQISQAGKYLRERDLLRQRDEADFYFSDEEEEEIEAEAEGEVAEAPEEDEDAIGTQGEEFVAESEEAEEDEDEAEADEDEDL